MPWPSWRRRRQVPSQCTAGSSRAWPVSEVAGRSTAGAPSLRSQTPAGRPRIRHLRFFSESAANATRCCRHLGARARTPASSRRVLMHAGARRSRRAHPAAPHVGPTNCGWPRHQTPPRLCPQPPVPVGGAQPKQAGSTSVATLNARTLPGRLRRRGALSSRAVLRSPSSGAPAAVTQESSVAAAGAPLVATSSRHAHAAPQQFIHAAVNAAARPAWLFPKARRLCPRRQQAPSTCHGARANMCTFARPWRRCPTRLPVLASTSQPPAHDIHFQFLLLAQPLLPQHPAAAGGRHRWCVGIHKPAGRALQAGAPRPTRGARLRQHRPGRRRPNPFCSCLVSPPPTEQQWAARPKHNPHSHPPAAGCCAAPRASANARARSDHLCTCLKHWHRPLPSPPLPRAALDRPTSIGGADAAGFPA